VREEEKALLRARGGVEKFTRFDGDVWRLRVRDSLNSTLCHSAVLPRGAALQHTDNHPVLSRYWNGH